ncbi:WD40-repeat-containing domain protein [Lyophyllum atratum]|nr:WD40-repeat-containing domain protein [Lyophyllum atratum]
MAATMLAICATGTLTVLDSAILKAAPSSVSSCLSLTQATTSSAWSPDNAYLFLASAQIIHRYEPTSNSLKDIYTSTEVELISHLLCKDKGFLIYSAADKIRLLECGSSAKITQTIESHKSSITSISLSNDYTLLASTSSDAVHVHNLTLGSHTVLKGLPLAGQNITTSAFHPHARTRLLLGVGKQLVVYDTTRPSGPLKTIPLNEATLGEIVAVACSPFSKTLVAVATCGGYVALIDLEKEKGLFRTLNVKVPLTSLRFSPEGAALYVGTEHGKLLIIDLRALDRTPKTVIISETGCRIETMSIQRKLKAGEAGAKATSTAASSVKPIVQPETNALPSRRPVTQTLITVSKAASSPARARVARVNSTASPARRLPSATSKVSVPSAKSTPKKPMPELAKKVFSPVRDPLGNSVGDISVQLETLDAVTKATPVKGDRKTSISSARTRLSSSPRAPSVPVSISATSTRRTSRESASEGADPPRRVRTVPAATRTRKATSTAAATEVVMTTGSRLTVPAADTLHPPLPQVSSRSRAASSASRAGSETTSASATSRSTRSTRPSSSASRPSSSISRHDAASPPLPPSTALPVSRTPSPDLPDILEPMTPVPAAKKGRSQPGVGMGVLGLGTPEVDRWIRAGKGEDNNRDRKGKGKTVGFKDESKGESDSDSDAEVRRKGDAEEREREREGSLTMQVSPRRPSTSWEPSPLRQSPGGVNLGGGSAHDFLRTIVKDVMYDFQRETRAEMTGLHLDLVRMGRGWKRELRSLMEEYGGGMDELREENRRLKEENERLRRGF